MKNTEFSDQFDELLNSQNNIAEFGDEASLIDYEVNEYDKSLFLTQAEKALVIEYYTGMNSEGVSFEEKERVREVLDALMNTKTYNAAEEGKKTIGEKHILVRECAGKSENDLLFELPKDLIGIVFEKIIFSSYLSGCDMTKDAQVIVATHDDLTYRLQNPFRGISWDRVLRLNVADNVVEILSDHPIGYYVLRYIREPKPIILTDLPDGLSIDGLSTETSCELPDSCHRAILENAVRLALQSKSIGHLNLQREKQQD